MTYPSPDSYWDRQDRLRRMRIVSMYMIGVVGVGAFFGALIT